MCEVIKEQQITLARFDKDARLKRILVAGISEENDLIYKKETATNDKQKINIIMRETGNEDIKIERMRRVGNKDAGPGKRDRYISLEFNSWSDRNVVKKSGETLKSIDELKQIFFKADSSKQEREEYARLYKEKEKIEKEFPERKVEINYGKLKVDNIEVDKIKHYNQVF